MRNLKSKNECIDKEMLDEEYLYDKALFLETFQERILEFEQKVAEANSIINKCQGEINLNRKCYSDLLNYIANNLKDTHSDEVANKKILELNLNLSKYDAKIANYRKEIQIYNEEIIYLKNENKRCLEEETIYSQELYLFSFCDRIMQLKLEFARITSYKYEHELDVQFFQKEVNRIKELIVSNNLNSSYIVFLDDTIYDLELELAVASGLHYQKLLELDVIEKEIERQKTVRLNYKCNIKNEK